MSGIEEHTPSAGGASLSGGIEMEVNNLAGGGEPLSVVLPELKDLDDSDAWNKNEKIVMECLTAGRISSPQGGGGPAVAETTMENERRKKEWPPVVKKCMRAVAIGDIEWNTPTTSRQLLSELSAIEKLKRAQEWAKANNIKE